MHRSRAMPSWRPLLAHRIGACETVEKVEGTELGESRPAVRQRGRTTGEEHGGQDQRGQSPGSQEEMLRPPVIDTTEEEEQADDQHVERIAEAGQLIPPEPVRQHPRPIPQATPDFFAPERP